MGVVIAVERNLDAVEPVRREPIDDLRSQQQPVGDDVDEHPHAASLRGVPQLLCKVIGHRQVQQRLAAEQGQHETLRPDRVEPFLRPLHDPRCRVERHLCRELVVIAVVALEAVVAREIALQRRQNGDPQLFLALANVTKVLLDLPPFSLAVVDDEAMVLSARTSPHVYSVYEVNFGRVSVLRERKKAEYEAGGVKLTFTAFIAKVAIDALRQFPIVNASLDGDNIVYKKDINLGIAVALDNGLIVPVIRNADEKNLLGLSRAINDLANRARTKKLNPEEVQGGTFTITNPGIFGALYGMPLINQPQVAILGVGSIEKRAVVIDDAIAIRPVCHITLGHDHRLVDGADAGRFLSFVKERLENFDEAWM